MSFALHIVAIFRKISKLSLCILDINNTAFREDRIAIVVTYFTPNDRYVTYKMAIDSLKCYARIHGYEFFQLPLAIFDPNSAQKRTNCTHYAVSVFIFR